MCALSNINSGLFLCTMHMHVTIFSTGGKFQPISNFTSYTLSLKPPVFMCSWLYDREVTNATSSTEMHVSYISEWTTILWTAQITKIWPNLSQSAKFNYEMYCNLIHGMVCYFFIWNQEHANHKSYSDSFHYWARDSPSVQDTDTKHFCALSFWAEMAEEK